MNWILVLSLAFLVFVTVKADLISDVDKYNDNFNNLVTKDYEKLIQLKDIGLGVFSELSGSATRVILLFVDFQWDTLDDVDKKATTNLLHGITERSKRIHLNCGRLFDILNIESIEEDFYKVRSDLWLRLVNTTTNRAHAKSNFYNYCTNYTFGPIATLDNIALHTYNNCQIPNEVNIDFYFRALDVFKSFEKEFQLDPEYLDLKRGLLRFALFEGDSVGVEEKIQALESIKVDFISELIEKLKEIEEVDDNNGR
uniref:Uncharacterized protein n=1 Tax=Panagrolaimus davidi TaxID=227884 RepID=A0A914Q2F0_9BILA